MYRAIGLLFLLLVLVLQANAEDVTFSHFKILITDTHGNTFPAPVGMVIGDKTLLIYGNDPNNPYQERTTIPFRNIFSFDQRLYKCFEVPSGRKAMDAHVDHGRG